MTDSKPATEMSSVWPIAIVALVLGVLVGGTVAKWNQSSSAPSVTESGKATKSTGDTIHSAEEVQITVVPASPALIAKGKELFAVNCATCHGADGDGKGQAAYLLDPKPRDLTAGLFRLVSTKNMVAQPEDTYRAITFGMPGSSMPPWDRLSEEDRWALVHYVRSLAQKKGKAPEQIEPGPEPVADAQSVVRGRQLFLTNCAACHGAFGRGDGGQKQVTSDGYPIRPRDLTLGIFKGSSEGKQLYYRIRGGIPGSPMPATETLSDEDLWHVVHYVKSLSGPGAEALNRQRYQTLAATNRAHAELPDDPQDPTWQKLPGTYLALMPLWWRNNRVPGLVVRTAYGEKDLVVHVSWEDEKSDDQQIHLDSFPDGAAIQLTTAPNLPSFAMGAVGSPDLRVWLWKASFQKDTTVAYQDVQAVNPNMHVPSYQFMAKVPADPFGAHLASLDSHDPQFLTARGLGNPVSKPHEGAVESMTAHGFGTLAQRPLADKGVRARGAWDRGVYSVVFRRPLKQEGEGGLTLKPGDTVHVAFAVWDGGAGDRNGQKCVTIWQALKLEQ